MLSHWHIHEQIVLTTTQAACEQIDHAQPPFEVGLQLQPQIALAKRLAKEAIQSGRLGEGPFLEVALSGEAGPVPSLSITLQARAWKGVT